MCTIVLLRGVVADMPLVLAANSDEVHGRPSEGAAWRGPDDGRWLGGCDLSAGGTWLGATRGGLLPDLVAR